MRVILNVNQEHIDKAQPGKYLACPVYYALAEALGRDDIAVGFSMYLMPLFNLWRAGDLLKTLHQIKGVEPLVEHLYTYDNTGHMEPFTTELDVPDSLLT